jgi:hypothetical protein
MLARASLAYSAYVLPIGAEASPGVGVASPPSPGTDDPSELSVGVCGEGASSVGTIAPPLSFEAVDPSSLLVVPGGALALVVSSPPHDALRVSAMAAE